MNQMQVRNKIKNDSSYVFFKTQFNVDWYLGYYSCPRKLSQT